MTTRIAYPFLIFFLTYAVYAVTNYGGIRSPDSEIVFRVAEAIVDSHDVSPRDLEAWHTFGVAQGLDGQWYSIYPPVESLWQTMLIPLARVIAGNLNEVPISHYVGTDLQHVLLGEPVPDRTPHAVRYVMSFFDVFVASMGIAVFYLILLRFTGSNVVSFFVSLIHAFGTIMWSYAGSCFSEPLTMLFVLSSYYLLIADLGNHAVAGRFLSSSLLGLAVATHATAILFVPFFLVQAIRHESGFLSKGKRLRCGGAWILGLTIMMLLQGWYNYDRFGDWLESGRNLSRENKVVWVALFSDPFWHNLKGVLFGASKGLFLYFPMLAAVLLVWPRFHKAHPWLSKWLVLLVIVRIIFNAAYMDWHAGYSLGPRYLLMMIPFTLMPLAWWLKQQWENRSFASWALISLAACAAVVEQWYFVSGEIFSFYHLINFHNLRRGVNVFVDDRIYLDWALSPLGHLLEFKRGPFLLREVPLSNTGLWMVGSAMWMGLTTWWLFYIRKGMALLPRKAKRKENHGA